MQQYNWGELRYIEVRYISRFHCNLLSFSLTADELLRNELDYLLTKQLRRRSKRSRYSYVSNRPRRSRSEFNARRYYKELARAQRLQNRRARQKMLHRTPITGKFRQSFSAFLSTQTIPEIVPTKSKLPLQFIEWRISLFYIASYSL